MKWQKNKFMICLFCFFQQNHKSGMITFIMKTKILHNSVFYKLSLVLLLISNLINELRLHQFLASKTTEANKSLKTDANGAHQ